FRPPPVGLFGGGACPPNTLRMSMNPDRMTLSVSVVDAEVLTILRLADLYGVLAPQALPPDARVLKAVFVGDPMLSIRDDEAEESWRIVQPFIAAWRQGLTPMLEYPAGSTGPRSG